MMARRIRLRQLRERLRNEATAATVGALIACAALWFGMLAASVSALTGSDAHAQASEYEVKAAYLLNFGKFIRIAGVPERPHSTFDICILGRDPIGPAIDDLVANESIDNRPARVVRITDATQGRACDIVFISPDEGDSIREDLALLAGTDALTVSDAPDFLERGGMIQFVLQGDHVRFEVNLNAVDRTHLVLSSELLRVATAVKGKPLGVRR